MVKRPLPLGMVPTCSPLINTLAPPTLARTCNEPVSGPQIGGYGLVAVAVDRKVDGEIFITGDVETCLVGARVEGQCARWSAADESAAYIDVCATGLALKGDGAGTAHLVEAGADVERLAAV